jgi:predicted ATPase
MVPQAAASVLGVREPARAVTEALVDSVQARAMLLILDNCEHVLDGCADLARRLISAGPHLRILTTSREPLGIPGEATYAVSPLAVPLSRQPQSPGDLIHTPSVRLFVERAAAVQPAFKLTDSNASAVAEICRRLDGIPLAIELAAARVKALSPQQISARLSDRFRLLSGGSHTLLPHHRTLEAALDWSHDLLGAKERALWRRLSVFSGWFQLDAVESICEGAPLLRGEVLDLLTSLLDKSLVVVDHESVEVRYRLLETVRVYGRDRLVDADEAVDFRNRHVRWYAELAERAEPEMQGPHQGTWFRRLEADHDNVRAALEWSMAEQGDQEAALRLAAAIRWFWEVRGYWREGRDWLERLITTGGSNAPPLLRARALHGIGFISIRLGDFKRVFEAGQESLALVSSLGDQQGRASSLAILGLHACAMRDLGRAEAFGTEGLALCRNLGHKWGIAASLHMLALVARQRGELDKADVLFAEELSLAREVGDEWVMAQVLRDHGLVARDRGDYERAEALTQEALRFLRRLGDRVETAGCLSNLGIIAWLRLDYGRAGVLFKESLTLRSELDDRPGIAVCLVGLAVVFQSMREYSRAAELFGAAEGLRKALGTQLPPFIRAQHDDLIAALRSALGEEQTTTLWTRGLTMTIAQMIELALRSASD